MDKTQPITPEQKFLADPILEAFGNLCLMSAYIPKWDKQVAIVCTFEERPDKSMFFKPHVYWKDLQTPEGYEAFIEKIKLIVRQEQPLKV